MGIKKKIRKEIAKNGHCDVRTPDGVVRMVGFLHVRKRFSGYVVYGDELDPKHEWDGAWVICSTFTHRELYPED